MRRPELLLSLISLLRTTELVDVGALALAALAAADGVVSAMSDAIFAAAEEAAPPVAAAADASSAAATADAPRGAAARADGGWAVWQAADALWAAVVPLLRHDKAAPRAIPC